MGKNTWGTTWREDMWDKSKNAWAKSTTWEDCGKWANYKQEELDHGGAKLQPKGKQRAHVMGVPACKAKGEPKGTGVI